MNATFTLMPARAIWFAGPRRVEVRDEPARMPGEGEVLVRALASAISHGTELLIYRGEVDPNLPLDLPTLSGSFAFPIKYGYAVAGEVIECGSGVHNFVPGDQIFALHPHQSHFCLPATLGIHLPAALDPLDAVFYANLETALTIVHDAAPRLGETVLVMGLGVVGLLVTQLLCLTGSRVVAVDPLARRRAMAMAFGATAALPPGKGLAWQVRTACGDRPVDLVIEASGTPAALQAAIEIVAAEGTVVVASWYGRKPVMLDLGGHFHRGRVRLRSSQVGHIAPELASRWDHNRRGALVRDMLPRLKLRELITHCFGIEDAAQVYQMLDERPEEAVQAVFVYA